MGPKLNHFNENGNAVMVDVSGKEATDRTALAVSYTHLTLPTN